MSSGTSRDDSTILQSVRNALRIRCKVASGCSSFAIRSGKEKNLPVLIWILNESNDREGIARAPSICAWNICLLLRWTGVKIANEL